METVLKKLRYAGQSRVLVLSAPAEMQSLVPALEAAGAKVDLRPVGSYPWAIAFVTTLAEAGEIARIAGDIIEGDGILWLAYPKGSSKRYSADVNRDSAWRLFEGGPTRLVAQVALDEDWSAVRVRRTEFSK